ncbi:MAG: hypothetical protein ACK56F_29590, partial [bacterium]
MSGSCTSGGAKKIGTRCRKVATDGANHASTRSVSEGATACEHTSSMNTTIMPVGALGMRRPRRWPQAQ